MHTVKFGKNINHHSSKKTSDDYSYMFVHICICVYTYIYIYIYVCTYV